MTKKIFFLTVLFLCVAFGVSAQRSMDKLDRGLVAVKSGSGVYCSWRVLGEEYYDVTYNIYRDGTKLNSQPLTVSNYTDAGGSTTSKYKVTAVVCGTEQAPCDEVTPWGQSYLEITPDHGSLTSTYVPNDACMADVDGDGELEILLKFDNASWASTSYQKSGYNGEYFIMEVYKLNGQKLWWVDFGPNMADFQNNEQNIVAYDWDGDGKAEAVMRASDGTVIHMADGTTQVIGDASKNYLGLTNTDQWFVHEGNEFLVYMNGNTGKPYQVMEYPLKRLAAGETDLNAAWGDGYGHRSTKHFFGAPYLDGRKPSIFLARGIYTRHKMIAFDVNPSTHQLTERWRWFNNTPGNWYGQGYHNYAVVDVDWDGRDEICFGSMVIDDNGRGLSTTGLGHGDAQHHGDFNPYVHGQETFTCNEDNPGNNYRDATTSKLYYRFTSAKDDGRCMAGNFSNEIPGAMAFSGRDEPISCVTNGHVSELIKSYVTDNFRIYWDGDLLEECFDGAATNGNGVIYKYKKGAIATLAGSMTNNDTKKTPCYQGDILGDWREEVVMRTGDNKIRIYTTTTPTEWRNYTLWHDMQYRNAMVWQMCGYNQPPHVSYFLGELEGITQAPPALTMTDRKEIANGGSISNNDEQIIMAETNDMTVSVSDGASPYIFFDNAPSWVQGTGNNDNIKYTYYTHTLTGGAFSGSMRLVKQGDGTLVLPTVTETYTGNTDVWAGTLRFDGTMQSSPVWLNRHTNLISDGGHFKGGITADYNATIYPGGKDKAGQLTVTNLNLNFGSRVVFDVYADYSADQFTATTLSIETKDWQNGPEYSTPVFEIVVHGDKLPGGKYLLATVGNLTGNLSDVVLEGTGDQKAELTYEDGKVYLKITDVRDAASVVWNGGSDGIWDLAETENFKLDGDATIFVGGDAVIFNDDAQQTTINVNETLLPSSVVFNNSSKNFTLQGTGSLVGNAPLTKNGSGTLTINNKNQLTGGVNLNAGKVTVSSLANTDGIEYGALGTTSNRIAFNGGTLSVSGTFVGTQPVTLGAQGGTIEVLSGKQLTLSGSIAGSKRVLSKNGNGTLVLNGSGGYGTLCINNGTVQMGEISVIHQYPDTVVLNGGTMKDPDDIYSYSTNKTTVVVPEGKTGTWWLDARCNYTGKLLGKGTLTIYVTNVRSNLKGDWSQFEGTLNFQKQKTGAYDPLIIWDNTKGLEKATLTGIFDNSGKNLSVGTIMGNATLTGNGTYSAKHLNLSVTRSRGNSSNTKIEVANTLSVTEDITIEKKGTGKLTAGEEIVLWEVKNFSYNANVVINLPTLPSGLYWDTTDLLTKKGTLRVTDIPTGIRKVENDGMTGGQYYTIDGVPVTEPLKKGVYIKNGKKVIIK